MELESYNNPALQIIMDKYITTEKYGGLKSLLEEVLRRRSFEFGFSMRRMEEETKRLVENVDSIDFMTEEEIEERDTTDVLASYKGKEKRIIINPEYYNALVNYYNKNFEPHTAKFLVGRDLFSVLTHELYHAIAYHKDADFGVVHKDENGRITGAHMNEVLTESAATRSVRTKSEQDFENGYMGTIGYQATTCFTNLLANAIGVSERELLSHGLNDRKEFDDFVLKSMQISLSESESKEKLDELYSLTSLMGKLDDENVPIQQKEAIYTRMYMELFDLAVDHMTFDQRPLSKEVIGEKQFRTQTMANIARSSLEYLERENLIRPGSAPYIVDRAGINRSIERMIVVGLREFAVIEDIDQSKYVLEELDAMVSEDMLKDKKKYELGFRKFIYDDYHQRTNWSDEVFIYMMDAFEKKMEDYERTLPPDKLKDFKSQQTDSGDLKVQNIIVDEMKSHESTNEIKKEIDEEIR